MAMLLPGDNVYFVYIMAGRTRVLYTGMTNNLRRRVRQHQEHKCEGFTDQYRCERLVYFERFNEVTNAISREKQIKRWRRDKELALIAMKNSAWIDLSEAWREEATTAAGVPVQQPGLDS